MRTTVCQRYVRVCGCVAVAPPYMLTLFRDARHNLKQKWVMLQRSSVAGSHTLAPLSLRQEAVRKLGRRGRETGIFIRAVAVAGPKLASPPPAPSAAMMPAEGRASSSSSSSRASSTSTSTATTSTTPTSPARTATGGAKHVTIAPDAGNALDRRIPLPLPLATEGSGAKGNTSGASGALPAHPPHKAGDMPVWRRDRSSSTGSAGSLGKRSPAPISNRVVMLVSTPLAGQSSSGQLRRVKQINYDHEVQLLVEAFRFAKCDVELRCVRIVCA